VRAVLKVWTSGAEAAATGAAGFDLDSVRGGVGACGLSVPPLP
jgi:hypothetical protein